MYLKSFKICNFRKFRNNNNLVKFAEGVSCKNISEDIEDEKILNNIISRIDEYEEYLNSIIIYFKRLYPIDEIEWLKKKIIN